MTDVPEIYVCDFLLNPQLIRMISCDHGAASLDDRLSRKRKYEDGKLLSPAEVASSIYYDHADYMGKELPPLFKVEGGYAVVTGACADVLGQFDLGQTQLHPIPLFEADKKTPVPGRFYLLNIAEHKDTLIPEQSEKLRNLGSDDQPVWFYRDSSKVVLRSAAAEGVDLWFEQRLGDTPFLSGRLVKALKAAGVRHLHPNQCRIA